MKAQIIAENLKRGISIAERIVGKNLTLPILSNVLLQAQKGIVKIFATNLEIGVSCDIRAKVEREGEVAVPARILGSFASGIKEDEKLALDVRDNTLFLAYPGNKASIKGMDSKDFPLIPKPQGEYLIELNSDSLYVAIQGTIVCAAASETRQELTGIYAELANDKITLAATDSFRLAEAVIKLREENYGKDFKRYISKVGSLLIPARTMQEVARGLELAGGKVRIYVGENQIFFEAGGVTYVSRLIDGKYPEYKQVIPKQFSSTIILSREALLRAVRTASVFSDSKSREIRIEAKEGEKKLRVAAQSVETGENINEVPAQIKIKGSASVAFNSRFLADGLISMSGDMIYIGLNDSFGPVAFREVEEGGKINQKHLHIIMPIKS